MATIEQVLGDPVEGPKAGRLWQIIHVAGGRIALTENGMLIEAESADRGNGTFGPEVWPFKSGL